MNIGPATGDDYEWCAQLMVRSEPWITLGRGLETCRARCTHPEHLLFVARAAGGTRAGFVIMHPRGVAGSPYIATIAVAEEFRCQGAGSRLIEFVESYFRESSRHIFLCVSSFNTHARRLYERLGYHVVGEFPDYVIEGASEILMIKRLDRP